MEMRDKAEDRVRCGSDDGAKAQRGLAKGPQSHSQWRRERSLRPSVGRRRWLGLLCWQGVPRTEAVEWRRRQGRASRVTRAGAFSCFIRRFCSAPGVMEIDQGVCQGVGDPFCDGHSFIKQ